MKNMLEGLNALDPKNNKKDTTSPAFPTTEEHGFNSGFPGMTLRDYFAAKIIASLLQAATRGNVGVHFPEQNKNFALAAYALADAMMEARSN